MNPQKELDVLNDLILKLNNKGYGTNLLKDDLIDAVKLALIAFKEQLEKSNRNNIYNVMRNIFLTSGLDIYNKFPHGILGQVIFNKPLNWTANKSFFIEDSHKTTWVLDQNYEFFPLNINSTFQQGILSLQISSPLAFNNDIINNIKFYGKGADFFIWFNEVIENNFILEINHMPMGNGCFHWGAHDLLWKRVENYNPWMEKLLYHWWFLETQRFFQWKLDDFGYTKQLILKIPCNFWDPNIAICHDYFYCLNYFYQESLPIHLDESNLYRPVTLNSNDRIKSVKKVINNGKAIDSLNNNYEDYYYPMVENNNLYLQLSGSLNDRLINENIIVEGFFFNDIMPINNIMVDENNNGSVDKITAIKIIENSVQEEEFIPILIDVFTNYIENYRINSTSNYIKNLWDYSKKMAQVTGTIHGLDFFHLEIIVNKFEIVPKVVFLNTRTQIVDVSCWWVSFNNKKYNTLLSIYLNGIVGYYGVNYQVIVE